MFLVASVLTSGPQEYRKDDHDRDRRHDSEDDSGGHHPWHSARGSEVAKRWSLEADEQPWVTLAGVSPQPGRHPPRGYASDPAYLPREVFFGRLGLAGPFFSVSALDFGRFFPATSAPSADRVIATE